MAVSVIIIGGLTPSLIDLWLSELPFFNSLKRSQKLNPLLSTIVPYEAPAQTTLFTGKEQGEHGVFSMWKMRGPNVNAIPDVIDSRELPVPYIWQDPDFGDRRALVMNIIGSHPPANINGEIITYPFYPTTNLSSPRYLMAELSKQGSPVAHDVSIFMRPDTNRESFIEGVIQTDRSRLQAYLKLSRRGTDFATINFTSIDRLSHFYWHETSSNSGIALKDMALLKAYKFIDKALLKIVEAEQDTQSIFILGDVAFGPLKKFVSVDEILEEAGFYKTGENRCPDPRLTLAFEAPQGSHGINLSCKSRFQDGLISPTDFLSVKQSVRQALTEAINPATGNPYFLSCQSADEIYSGQSLSFAPDLVVIPYDEEYSPKGHGHWANHVSRDLQSGWHRRKTICAQLNIDSVKTEDEFNLLDIYSSIRAELGMSPHVQISEPN